VSVLPRPAIVRLHLRLEYPPYLKLPPRDITSADGVIEVPARTRVSVRIESSTPLARARIVLDDHALPAQGQSAAFIADRDAVLSIEMTSVGGVEGRFTGGRIIVLPDRPPVISVDAPPAQASAARVTYHAVDDLALARIDAEISRGYGQQKIVPIALVSGAREQSGVLALEAGKVGLSAGEVADVQLRVEDRAGQFTLSPTVRMSVLAATSAEDVAPSPQQAQDLDLPQFKDSLDAYFRAISSVPGR
jgi:hypothetical protein